LSGKVYAYNDETSQARFEGHVNLFSGSKNFDITSTAIGAANFESNEVRLNSFLMIDTDVPSAAFDVMARDLQEVIKNEGAEEGLGDQTELLYKIANIIGEAAVKEYESQSVQGYVPLGTLPELAKPLVFSDVKLKWSPELKAFYNDGRLGISNSGKNDINGRFEGFMEIRRTADGLPVFNVFFKASAESWYYFGIEDNRLLIHSSNKDFNSIISKKSTAGKAKIGEVAFIPGSEEETLAFINRFRKQYLGIEVPYSLYESATPAEDAPVIDNQLKLEDIQRTEEEQKDNTQPVDGFGPAPEKKVDPASEVEPGNNKEPNPSDQVEPGLNEVAPEIKDVEPGVKEEPQNKEETEKKEEDRETEPEIKKEDTVEKEPEIKKEEDDGF
jgi:hypothetical protein